MKRMQALLTEIPKGKVTTYKALAHAMGTRGYRYVGQLLNKNPDGDRYPCYKVVNSDGRLGGYAHGLPEKVRRLKADGLTITNGRISDLKSVLFPY